MEAHLTRILLVSEQLMARLGIVQMLKSAPSMQVIGQTSNAAEALELVKHQTYDCAIVDMVLPDKNGLDLIKSLKQLQPSLVIIMLGFDAGEVFALRAIRLGASGFLNKNCSIPMLHEAIKRATAGKIYISPSLLDQFADLLGNGKLNSHETLSERELDVFRRIALGESLVFIAKDLGLSPNTVTTYRSRIFTKMGLKSNSAVTRYAMQHGLIA